MEACIYGELDNQTHWQYWLAILILAADILYYAGKNFPAVHAYSLYTLLQ